MRLREYFYENEGVAHDDEEEQDPLEFKFTVKRKSNFTPKKGRNFRWTRI